MNNTKLPSARLALTYTFDLPAIVKDASAEVHSRACKKAAEHLGLVAATAVEATASLKPGLTLASVHEAGFDPSFHVADGGQAVRYEFFYDPQAPKMAMRVVTSLGEEPSMIVDGVLASRIGLHAMELLEGSEMTTTSPAMREGKIPPFSFGLRQHLNFIREIPGSLLRILLARLSILLDSIFGRAPPPDTTLVNDAKSLHRFAEGPHADDPAHSLIYRAPEGLASPFRVFLALAEAWRLTLGLVGYFYLINFSPLVAPGVTSDAADMLDIKKRYKGAFDRPGCGPPPPLWAVANAQLSRRLVFNNYGIHTHNFTARPVAFVWDWLELAAPLNGAGCITINGTFLSWARGMPSALRMGGFESRLGAPVTKVTQNTRWFADVGLPKSIASKARGEAKEAKSQRPAVAAAA